MSDLLFNLLAADETLPLHAARPLTKDSSGNLYCLTAQHLQKSTDSGATWTAIDLPVGVENMDTSALCIDGNDHIHLFWQPTSEVGVWHSYYNGTAWSENANVCTEAYWYSEEEWMQGRYATWAVCLSKDNKIYLAGEYRVWGDSDLTVVRYHTYDVATATWGTPVVLHELDREWHILDICAHDTNDVTILYRWWDDAGWNNYLSTETIGSAYVDLGEIACSADNTHACLMFDTALHVCYWGTDGAYENYTLWDNTTAIALDNEDSTPKGSQGASMFYDSKPKVLYTIIGDKTYLAGNTAGWAEEATGVQKGIIRALWSMYPSQCRDVYAAAVQDGDNVSFIGSAAVIVHSFPWLGKFQLTHVT